MQLLLFNLGIGEVLFIGLVYLLFFGSKNFPTVMRDFGRFIFKIKSSASDIYKEISADDKNA